MAKVTTIKSLNDLQHEALLAHDIRFDPNDSQPDYIGLNQMTESATDAVSWLIYKFTYDGSNVTRIQKAQGSWDDRVALFA